ncbi:MAG: flagellar basal body L-ring protein FlgH [Terriglobales bacterium]
MALPLAAQKGKVSTAAATPQLGLPGYLARVNQIAAATATTTGSLWTPDGRFNDLSTDTKAHNVNDLLMIHVLEATSATGSGTLQSKRDFSAASGFSGLFGQLAPTSKLQVLFAPNSNTNLDSQAQSAATSNLETSLTGRVVEVMPNGYLVVEAMRNIAMNNQQQTLIVHGVVRPADIAPDNSVLSTQVGELEIELQGKGVISDTTRPVSGWIHILMKFLTF